MGICTCGEGGGEGSVGVGKEGRICGGHGGGGEGRGAGGEDRLSCMAPCCTLTSATRLPWGAERIEKRVPDHTHTREYEGEKREKKKGAHLSSCWHLHHLRP